MSRDDSDVPIDEYELLLSLDMIYNAYALTPDEINAQLSLHQDAENRFLEHPGKSNPLSAWDYFHKILLQIQAEEDYQTLPQWVVEYFIQVSEKLLTLVNQSEERAKKKKVNTQIKEALDLNGNTLRKSRTGTNADIENICQMVDHERKDPMNTNMQSFGNVGEYLDIPEYRVRNLYYQGKKYLSKKEDKDDINYDFNKLEAWKYFHDMLSHEKLSNHMPSWMNDYFLQVSESLISIDKGKNIGSEIKQSLDLSGNKLRETDFEHAEGVWALVQEEFLQGKKTEAAFKSVAKMLDLSTGSVRMLYYKIQNKVKE
ncbi:MAG: hypothetical protein R6V55_09575 [Desulfovermiculus sp.]